MLITAIKKKKKEIVRQANNEYFNILKVARANSRTMEKRSGISYLDRKLNCLNVKTKQRERKRIKKCSFREW